MTNAKNKKSVIAIIAMAFLLVASIVLAATGAWFTSSDKGTGTADITFGKVAVSITGLEAEKKVAISKCTEAILTVDKCSWDIKGLGFKNDSTVDIYYAYSVEVKTEGVDAKHFTITNENTNSDGAFLAANGTFDPVKEMKVVFDSNNELNGNEATAKITVTVKIAAIQAAHMEGADEEAKLTSAKAQLATLLAA